MTATNMCSNFGGKWDSPLKFALYASGSTPNRSIGYAPFEMSMAET